MAHRLIKDLKVGETVDQYFLVKRKDLRRTRSYDEFINVTLTDVSGDIRGKIWKEKIHLGALFRQGNFVRVKAVVDQYGEYSQLIIENIENISKLKERGKLTGFELSLLVPRTSYDVDELYQRLMGIIDKEININSLKYVTKRILIKYEKEFKECPAARFYHHSYLGGLIEHTYFVTKGVMALVDSYGGFNRSLAICGAILHDIGKLREIQSPAISLHTYEGELLGHMLLGRDILREESINIDWEDDRLKSHLEHIIVSHHGELEFGSPVMPKTREALLIHFCDNLDAQMDMLNDYLRLAGEGEFTEWHPVLKRTLCKSDFNDIQGESDIGTQREL